MVNNLACEDCRFLVKCSAYAKLKPFLETLEEIWVLL